jgi:hypothetical protein
MKIGLFLHPFAFILHPLIRAARQAAGKTSPPPGPQLWR